MAHFPMVKALDLTSVTRPLIQAIFVFLLLMRLLGLSYIDSNSRGGAFSIFSVFLALFFFLLFPSFFGRFIRALGT